MKKILKNTSLTIITVILAFMFVINVEAAGSCGNLSSNYCKVTDRGVIKVAGEDWSKKGSATSSTKSVPANLRAYSDIGVQLTGKPGAHFSGYTMRGVGLYCFDAQFDGQPSNYAYRFLLSSGDAVKKSFDTAIMSIITNSGAGLADPSSNLSDYWSRLLAVRAVYYTYGYYSGGGKDSLLPVQYAGMSTVSSWMAGNDAYNKLNAAVSSRGGSLRPASALNQHSNYSYTGGPVEVAKGYYNRALEEAAQYLNGYSAANDGRKGNIVSSPVNVNGTRLSRIVTHTFTVPGGVTSFVIKGIKFDNDVVYRGLTASIKSIKVGNTVVSPNAELKGYVPSSGATVTVEVEFSGDKNALDCNQGGIKYYIDGFYKGAGSGDYKGYVGIVWRIVEKNTQSYVSAEKGGTGDGSGEQNLIDLTSNETSLLDCTTSCKTYVDAFECCDENNNLIVSENDNKKVSILGPGPSNPNSNNIKVCFVDGVDKACVGNDCTGRGIVDDKSNSYSLEKMNSNKYCTVSCKEDYLMTMPTARIVNAGRYFTFKAQVNGVKSCYTNTINIEQYNKDIIAKQEEMVNAYANYLKWKAIVAASIKSRTAKAESSNSDCISEKTVVTNGVSSKVCEQACTAKNSTEWTEYYIDGANYTDYYVSNKNFGTGTISVGTRGSSADYDEDGHVDGVCTAGNCFANCTPGVNGSSGTLDANRNENLRKAIKRLSDAKEAYEKNIETFAQCTNGWITESLLKYDPIVYYDYDEKYLDAFGIIGKMDAEGPTNVGYDNEFCIGKGSVDKDYNCTTGGIGGRDGTLITRSYVVCGESGCKVDPKQVSQANYLRTTSQKTVTYKPATLFYNIYPSGEITINSGAANSVPIENGLPVSLGTKRGIYNYKVNIERLGEFYSNGSLGRYVGGNSKAVVEPSKLEYNCAYLVNIPKRDGWVCNFDNCPECISNCVGPNCPGYCDGGNCVADCVGLGCIYDSSAGSSMIEKQVSLNKLFPEGTSSYNWDGSKNDKAKKTVEEIEGQGNKVYDDNPILSITINPSTAREIKRYNQAAEANGGYSSSTMSCYKLGSAKRGACYSSFITEVLSNNKYGIVDSSSLVLKDSTKRIVGNDNTGYFKLWSGEISDKKMIGPSWK